MPLVPVAVEYRDHTDARLQEVQTQAQLTIASLTVRAVVSSCFSLPATCCVESGMTLLTKPLRGRVWLCLVVQAMLNKKNETVKQYQQRLEDMAREREAERASDAAYKVCAFEPAHVIPSCHR